MSNTDTNLYEYPKGSGSGDRFWFGDGCGYGYGSGFGDGNGHEYGNEYGYWYGYGFGFGCRSIHYPHHILPLLGTEAKDNGGCNDEKETTNGAPNKELSKEGLPNTLGSKK